MYFPRKKIHSGLWYRYKSDLRVGECICTEIDLRFETLNSAANQFLLQIFTAEIISLVVAYYIVTRVDLQWIFCCMCTYPFSGKVWFAMNPNFFTITCETLLPHPLGFKMLG